MSVHVFDTDMFSLYQYGDPTVLHNTLAHLSTGLAITVITVEEQLSGWYTMIRRAKTPPQQANAYVRLATSARSYTGWTIMDFSEPTVLQFEKLRSMKLGVGGNDLRIAAIVLDQAATLVTRNTGDFQRVPGLQLMDWSVRISP